MDLAVFPNFLAVFTAGLKTFSSTLWADFLPQPAEGVVILVHDAFLEGDDGVIGDGDVLGTDLGATFGDIAKTDALGLLEFRQAVFGVQRMHLQCSGIDQETRADEFGVHVMIAQDVADILAEEAFDALAELLHTINVFLLHPPGAIRGIGLAWFEFLDLRFDTEIP